MADQFHHYGWILVAVGVACILSFFFLAPGVLALGMGLLSLIVAAILRRLPALRRLAESPARMEEVRG